MTAPTDSFAAIVAELRTTGIEWLHEKADRIERLDAEMRKDSDLVTYMLLCTDADNDPDDTKGEQADTIWDDLGADRQDLARTFCLGVSHKAVQEANTCLRARLAACEKDAERYRFLRECSPIRSDVSIHVREGIYKDGYYIRDSWPSREELDASVDRYLATRASVPKDAATGDEGKE